MTFVVVNVAIWGNHFPLLDKMEGVYEPVLDFSRFFHDLSRTNSMQAVFFRNSSRCSYQYEQNDPPTFGCDIK